MSRRIKKILRKHLLSVVSRAKKLIGRLTVRRALAGTGIWLGLLAILYGASFIWPRTVRFSFATDTCLTNPVLLPNLVSKRLGSTYGATPDTSVSFGGYPLYSHKTCISPIDTPREYAAETVTFGSILFKKSIRVESDAYPALANQQILEKPVSTQDPLLVELNTADRIFDYRLKANKKDLDCTKQESSVACDVSKLKLDQSKKYDFTMERLYEDKPSGTMFKRELRTVKSINIVKSTIGRGQTVYDKPNKLVITLNRPAVSADDVRLQLVKGDKKRQDVPITTTVSGTKLTVSFKKPLARDASFEFYVRRVNAEDGGFLSKPYSLPFRTSGGPKVQGVNIGTYMAPTSGSVVIWFDSSVSGKSVQKFAQLEAGGKVLGATVSAQGNSVVITPTAGLPRCTPFTVKVLDGLQNSFGISGGSAWQYNSRTICQSVFSIGASVQGRGITAYSFGTGPNRYIFVGATHGDETSSVYILNGLVEWLESRGGVPARSTVTIIPNLNPDGFAAQTRTNAHNVDLNRNFPANDWKKGVTMPGGGYNSNGGGSKPLSEPESAALASYVLSQSPRLVLTYHAVAGVVIPNDSGDSVSLANVYAQKSSVGYASNSSTGSIFQYDTTGAFETWLHDKPGIPTLLIELWTKYGGEFGGHQDAMWDMINR